MTRIPETAKILPFPTAGIGPTFVGGASNASRGIVGGSASDVLLTCVSDYIEARGGGEGHFRTPMDGVHIMRAVQEVMPIRNIYRPSLCVVVQGAKEIMFGDDILHYAEMECLVVSIELPAAGRMLGATPRTPFLGVNIEFDVAMLKEVMQQLAAPPKPIAASGPALFVGQVDTPLSECILRLVRMASTPDAVPVLYPSAMREVCYWLLTGPYGSQIARLALPGTHTERVADAIQFLRENYMKTLRVDQLAEAARMSSSSFHQHFRTMTSMTPVQYQKQLRMLEARRLMVTEAANVSEAAYRVGYESASQFSREYTRNFGVPPKRDALTFKALLASGAR